MENQLMPLLSKLININSAYPNEERLIDFLFKFFKNKGFKTFKQKVEKERFNLLIEKGNGSKSILLYAHTDTIDIVNGWKTNPFELVIKNDKAIGLGAWDMKGGITANILSFIHHQPKNYKLKMVFCVDEENISKGGHKLISSDFIKDVNCTISTEPSFFYGNNGIVIGRPGRAVFNMKISGKPKHYALYDKNIDINLFVADLIKELGHEYKKNGDKKQFLFVKKINSQTIGMSTPHTIDLEIDSSIIPPKTSKEVKKQIVKIAKKINTRYYHYFSYSIDFIKRKTPFLESYEIPKNNRCLKILQGSVLKITNKKAMPYFRSSIADENIFGSHGKTVLGIGPIGGNAHAPNEWVSISSIKTLYNILINFLENYDLG